ncbi:MAG: hypothetical protein CL582_23375 [Alteromonadaceae bacterium]|nr:hypothetical protein [Alteromonadaceae bacterium]|tara:strand:- start:2167 stop:3189 length:1023 start_codon:yes stop_codon:yes gene_type:complete
MIDIQAVYIRDVAKLQGVNFMSMIRVKPDEEIALGLPNSTFNEVVGVRVNGQVAQFFLDFSLGGTGNLLIALPLEMMQRGLTLGSISEIRVLRSSKDSDGNDVEVAEIISGTSFGGVGGKLNTKAPSGSMRVTVDGGVLRLTGAKFDKTVGVYVNKKSQPFIIIDSKTVVCSLPRDTISVDDIEVITTAKKISRTSLFSYIFSDNMSAIDGEFKLVQQFIKVLLTTPGSDVFNKSLGGGLQHWVGENTPVNNPQALVAKTMLKVMTVGAKFAAMQAISTVPASERLSDVQVLNVDFDREDPSVVNLSIQLNTFARRQATISMMIGTAEAAISSIVGDAGI